MKTIPAPAHLRLPLAAVLLALTSSAAFAQAPVAPAATPAVGATTTAPGGTGAAEKPKPLSPADKKFIKDSGKSIYFELQLADSAKTGATSDATKKFAEQVNTEMHKAWEALGALAKEKGETIPAELTGGDKGSAERLKKTKGDNFDKLFFREFMKEAKSLDRDFLSASKNTTGDADIKNFAVNYLAIVKGHVNDGEKAEKASQKKP